MQNRVLFIVGLIVLGAILFWLARRFSSATNPEILKNDARRFARLLVADIKLYNQTKIEIGKRNNDIYSQLETEIEQARDKYYGRFNKGVTEEDHFDAQIVELLADGDANKMGARYSESKRK